ncbi:hypothetical protein [Carboxylicivirga marina]|uniref:Uncharacterized protein n=1 Tax=Carboxylicivirga marina TaxID=2800988 RepID=A0ABS1HHI1_9BACT|nr:hypothetical protein [Carboxylicivirga marina]MBK3516930.1 hypothetical protein [Carboxylicivirga marina]
MKAKYKFYPDDKLLAEAFYGQLSLQDLQRIVQQQALNQNFNSLIRTYSDIRSAEIVVSLNKLTNYINELKSIMSKKPFRWAIVSNKPNTTALSMLIKNDEFFDKKVQIYSTPGSALRFLGVNITPQNILSADFNIIE